MSGISFKEQNIRNSDCDFLIIRKFLRNHEKYQSIFLVEDSPAVAFWDWDGSEILKDISIIRN